ncbi:antibiotic biosynthesis monooxygenase [Chromobacterium sp. S0633]|uniref:antibiotic biosynthesis monooxygenase family protein n=1 Tax=Chromobacterium sp. S0633 TaxID=2957805 RepID=UPI0020A0210F|nr:antibiotic biosynthesis monooxygenase [Chromobacterium sp. S0633]MCP1290174.1 antibiotic biosynthesis monooxygenase [Chromobacterium sp. S0633]
MIFTVKKQNVTVEVCAPPGKPGHWPYPFHTRNDTVILEAALLHIKPGLGPEFEVAFTQASKLIAAAPGYLGHELQRCLEQEDKYLLLVRWTSVEAHQQGFRQSAGYLEWKQRLHHFYQPFPVVEHFSQAYPPPRA